MLIHHETRSFLRVSRGISWGTDNGGDEEKNAAKRQSNEGDRVIRE